LGLGGERCSFQVRHHDRLFRDLAKKRARRRIGSQKDGDLPALGLRDGDVAVDRVLDLPQRLMDGDSGAIDLSLSGPLSTGMDFRRRLAGLQAKMEAMGFSFFLNGQSEEILGTRTVEGLRLKDGRTIGGQMVIISAGVKPNIKLAQAMGLETKNGILVNDRLETKPSPSLRREMLQNTRATFMESGRLPKGLLVLWNDDRQQPTVACHP
jgi:hypothetical protein